MQLENLTTYEVQKYLEHKKTIIIPFGSTEQHGPHLPIGTDTFIAEAIARQAGLITQTMVAPVMPVGFSPGLHTHFAGTISLSASTYLMIVQDTLAALLASGFSDFFLLTGHGLNYSPLKTGLLEFLDRHNARALLMGYWELDELQPLIEEGDGIHCTILETSLMLYLKSELVDMQKGVDEYKKARFLLGKDGIREISASGVIAETMKSTREKGKQYYEAVLAGMNRVLKTFDDPKLFDNGLL
jgi:creatinine amidohydrolase